MISFRIDWFDNYYYAHFIDEETETQRSICRPQLAQLASGRARIQSWAVPARGCVQKHLYLTSHALRNLGHSLIHPARMHRVLLGCRPNAQNCKESQLCVSAQASPTSFLTAPRTLPLTWEQTHHSQDGDSVLMHWPWEVREAMTEWVQRLFWNGDKVQKP